MILAETMRPAKRQSPSSPMQREDFVGIFEEMGGRPVIINRGDPPLHEFLPKAEDLRVDIGRMLDEGASGKAMEAATKMSRQLKMCTSRIRCSVCAGVVSASTSPAS